MSYVVIWLQACLHWRCAYFQTLSWNDTIFVVDWDILYKLCGSANKWSKGFVFSGKIWWQFFSSNKACSQYHTHSTTAPKYTLTQRLVRTTVEPPLTATILQWPIYFVPLDKPYIRELLSHERQPEVQSCVSYLLRMSCRPWLVVTDLKTPRLPSVLVVADAMDSGKEEHAM